MDKEKEQLITENIRLAYYVAKRFLNSGIEYDDLVSVASLGLVKAAKKFNQEKGVQFNTFAMRVMTNEILMELRSIRRREKCVSLSERVLGEEEDVELLDMIPDTEDKFAIVEEADWLQRKMSCLNERERCVIKANLQYQGVAQDKKCVLLGISQSYYSRIVRSARSKILN